MDDVPRSRSLFRVRLPHAHHRVTYVELFFDLVFVFAITQLSHTLLSHFTPAGALETGLLLCAVWWVWVYTSWITNWLDPGRLARLVLFKSTLRGWLQLSHLAGIAGLSVLLIVGEALPPLALGALVSSILVAVAVWESISLGARAPA